MHKDFVPPVSVEEFAAYLDYNLAADEMQSIDIALSQDESLRQLATLSDEADMAMAKWQPEYLPFDIDSLDFDFPQIEDFFSFGFIC
ncbi:MAG: hypothetical protein SPF85_06915 [Alloprevotella sp.]|nr:hypothetical protein [Alloprevotella sp.]